MSAASTAAPLPERVTQAEFARALGVSRPYVHKLVAKGTIPLDADGLIDPQRAIDAIAAAADPGDQIARASNDDTPAMREIREKSIGGGLPDTSQDDEAPDSGGLSGITSYQAARIEREIQMGRQARERADQIAMLNAIRRNELAPVHAIEEVLARAGARVAAILDALPGALRRRVPTLTAQDIAFIQGEIAQARNIAASISLADLDAKDEPEAESAGAGGEPEAV